MIPVLRPDQEQAKSEVYAAWASGARNVMLKMDTGTGKTVTFSDIVRDVVNCRVPCVPDINGGYVVVLAHRDQLIGQISLAVARYGIRHRIIASKETARNIISAHLEEFKQDYTDPRSRVAVVSVDTFIRLNPKEHTWLSQVTLFVPDEAHHVLRENKWGKAYALLPTTVYSLMPTATPGRPDGKGLGRHADGIADRLIMGTTIQNLIDWGHRRPFTIYAPPASVDMSAVDVSATTGDFVDKQLRETVHRESKKLIGNLVDHYLHWTPGKVGATFAVDVEEAGKISQAYKAHGIPSEVITGKTPLNIRAMIMRRLRNRELKQVVSVDILGEGTDVPALEVVSLGRPTASGIVYSQQVGRARGIDGEAYILDAVGNVLRHGLPTTPRKYTLDAREKRGRGEGMDDAIPLTSCGKCHKPYERFHHKCPYCGHMEVVTVTSRSALRQVDGDLVLLTGPEVSLLEQERAEVDGAFKPNPYMPEVGQLAAKRRHRERQEAQAVLRYTMSLWMGWQNSRGMPDRDAQRLFYLRYRIDYMSAQVLGAADAYELNARIFCELSENHVQELRA